ncbi:MAG: GNAT family N-acetyltransferase [Clostridia bacterium]|nr:GNAT family N-acetyltransferase [Clostridia bacterium]
MLERLSNNNINLFERAFALYKSSFPEEERRDEAEQERALKKDDYHFDLIMDGDTFIGVMLYWETDNLVFLEHFTTCPEIRGNGYGKKALDLLKAKNKLILLEIETPADEITQRRYGFYKRNGFVMNSVLHIQAKYHVGDEDLELKVLTYPRALENDEYRDFYEYMTREIGIQANKATDITIRKLEDGDDLNQVAKLIYLTDPYVYPRWFDSIEDGISVIKEMISLPTLYNKENIAVAVMPNGVVAGIVVSKQAPFVENYEDVCKAFELSKIPMDSRTKDVFNAYYAKMGQEEDGYYIANISVDPDYRNRGIAASLLSYAIKDKSHCSLECVIANQGAWRLYQRMGFKIAFEYPGVHGIPCYKMNYRR